MTSHSRRSSEEARGMRSLPVELGSVASADKMFLCVQIFPETSMSDITANRFVDGMTYFCC